MAARPFICTFRARVGANSANRLGSRSSEMPSLASNTQIGRFSGVILNSFVRNSADALRLVSEYVILLNVGLPEMTLVVIELPAHTWAKPSPIPPTINRSSECAENRRVVLNSSTSFDGNWLHHLSSIALTSVADLPRSMGQSLRYSPSTSRATRVREPRSVR